MNGPPQSNFEIANFFRSHSKDSKLTKEELTYIDSLIFPNTSPTKKILPLFPRATPLQMGRETPLFNSRTTSFPSTGLRTSRKTLEIFDKELELSKSSFILNEEPVATLENRKRHNDEVMEDSTENSDKIPKLESENVFKSANYHTPPRQMTDAAKELMASINMNVDIGSKNNEDLRELTNPYVTNLPKFEFEIPGKKLPEFHFDISESVPPKKNTSVTPDQAEYKFDFSFSDFQESKPLDPTLESKIPNFYFKID